MKLITYIVFISLFTCISFAQTIDKDIIIKAKKKKYFHKEQLWELIGDPMIKNEQDTLFADSIKYFTKEKKGISVGNVKLYDHDNTIEAIGSYGEYFTETKYAKLVTDTKLDIIKDDIIVYSDFLERYGEKGIYVASENVEVILEKDEATAVAGEGVYEVKTKKVILHYDPKIYHNNAIYSADKITILTDTKEIILEGNSVIKKENQRIYADKIHYYSKDPFKKAILDGNPKLVELSDNDSFLYGKPYRYANADKIVYFNVTNGKAKLMGNAGVVEYFLDSKDKKNGKFINYKLYKRVGNADTIKYIGGSTAKYAFIGNAKVYEPYRAAFAERIDYFDSANPVSVLRGKPVIFEFYEKNELGYKKNKIKRKGNGNIIKYYSDSKKIVLEGNAKAYEKDLSVDADYIEYTGGNIGTGYAKGHAKYEGRDDYAEADIIKYFGKSQERIVLAGNGFYKNKDITLYADFIDHYNKAQKSYLKGNAKIYDKDKQAFGDDIVYTKENGVENATLKGSPGIIKENQIAYGDVIEYKKTEKDEYLYLDGNANLRKLDQSAYADQIVMYKIDVPGQKKNDEKMILTSNVRLEDKERIIKGDKGEYYVYKKDSGENEKGIVTGNCDIYNKEDGSTAFSDDLEYYKNVKNEESIILKGNAEVNDEKKSGYADEIRIYPNFENSQDDKAELIGNPKIEDEKSLAYGDKIEIWDGVTNEIRIFDNAKYISDEDSIEIRGDYFVYDQDREVLLVEKNPVLIQKEDELIVYSNRLESFRKTNISLATGDVKIEQKKKKLYGEQAKLYENKDELHVTGNASAVENNNVSRAKLIILNTDTNEIRMEGVKKGKLDTSKDKDKNKK